MDDEMAESPVADKLGFLRRLPNYPTDWSFGPGEPRVGWAASVSSVLQFSTDATRRDSIFLGVQIG